MNTFIADANLIIRYLTNDDEVQSSIAKRVMYEVDDGIITLYLMDIIIMEVCWVLKSVYGFDKNIIAETLIHLCGSEGVITESVHIVQALELFTEKNVDLADALLSLKSNAHKMPIITWNTKDFKKLSCEFYKPEELKY